MNATLYKIELDSLFEELLQLSIAHSLMSSKDQVDQLSAEDRLKQIFTTIIQPALACLEQVNQLNQRDLAAAKVDLSTDLAYLLIVKGKLVDELVECFQLIDFTHQDTMAMKAVAKFDRFSELTTMFVSEAIEAVQEVLNTRSL